VVCRERSARVGPWRSAASAPRGLGPGQLGEARCAAAPSLASLAASAPARVSPRTLAPLAARRPRAPRGHRSRLSRRSRPRVSRRHRSRPSSRGARARLAANARASRGMRARACLAANACASRRAAPARVSPPTLAPLVALRGHESASVCDAMGGWAGFRLYFSPYPAHPLENGGAGLRGRPRMSPSVGAPETSLPSPISVPRPALRFTASVRPPPALAALSAAARRGALRGATDART
jgi:hypothetical protein